MSITLDDNPIDMPPMQRSAWGTAISLGFHAALFGLLLLGPNKDKPEPLPPPAIAVELMTAAQFAALTAPPQTPPAAAPAAPTTASPGSSTTTPAAKAAPGGTIRATEFFAGSLLAEPESAKLRAAMTTLDGSERLVQLCSIEAIEQIRRARPEFDPDTAVAYAMADLATRDGALIADGGAFRSRREWYEVKFSCVATADYSAVERFEFSVGGFIPHDQWEEHYLTAAESDE
ncbi:hypothetical protein ASC89_02980 [Devosia sp. Root413D1]|uniref:DUF930 domain-containing protein n=1 Tax=Devosia sp. Root413D1 TaxID=1736531 RepID=UPI0006F53570|nr:DUF930 domain-containing protein [Devosia sp. Root413D1]KQW86042.1 hypothetical protein ASC89_02980 [Devosia sp. Root413D1]